MSSVRVAVLTISDTSYKDASTDLSGPTIREILTSQSIYTCTKHTIVPDDESAIRSTVLLWTGADDVDWIITTGGTGFGQRDCTPEAILPLIDRPAPGLVHLLLSTSLTHTPLAALSRPVAGTIRDTLIVTLPGSVKAVKENLNALLNGGVIEHAVDLTKGGSGKQVHQSIAGGIPRPSSHHHHHHHDHTGHSAPRAHTMLSHDPSGSVAARHRSSPFPMISVDEAIAKVLEIQPLEIADHKLAGFVLAEDVQAFSNVPFSSTTSVDGYALRASDAPGTYQVHTHRTHALSEELPTGYVYRINTGGPLPRGTDSVIMVEDTKVVKEKDGEEVSIETLAQVSLAENVRSPGSDVRTGDLVLSKGDVLKSGGGEIGTLAFVGRKEVKVHRKPVVAIMSTGNELIDWQNPAPLAEDGWGGIYDTNRPSLQAALEGLGYEIIDLGIISDDLDSHISTMKEGLERADLLLTTGGTSMGPSDLLKPVIERDLGGTIHFGRITAKPGKPTTYATVDNKPIFALPGNPASALVMFNVFVVPALRRLGGWAEGSCQLPRVKATIKDAMRLDSRTEFHRVVLRVVDGGLVAESTGDQRSSRVASLSGANGLVVLPPRQEGGPESLDAGSQVDVMVIGEIQM